MSLGGQELAGGPLEPAGVGDVEDVLHPHVAGQVAHQVEERDGLAAAGQALDRRQRDVVAQHAFAHRPLLVVAGVERGDLDLLELVEAAQVDGVVGLVVVADRVHEDRAAGIVAGRV